MQGPYVLALDCGTTGNRAIIFDQKLRVVASKYAEFSQYYPKPGWVEHDAEEIWQSVLKVTRAVLKRVPKGSVAALGLTNQRETIAVWDPRTLKPVGHAIVWQCRRSARLCGELRKRGLESKIHRKTGLFLDPYFSASKLLWLAKHKPRIHAGLKRSLVCGTIDSWIIARLTGGQHTSTDPTNASRTMLYDIRKGAWDKSLCQLFKVPLRALPKVLPSSGIRAWTHKRVLGVSIPIAGVVGDQQSAAFAQGCFKSGIVKNTYGTGLFVVAETGSRIKYSKSLVTTVACSLTQRMQYALEGSVFIGGAAIQWLRDGLKILKSAAESEVQASQMSSNEGVYFVPALVGLGCPHWDPHARGLIIGITRQTERSHFVRAALESIAYQTRDVLDLLRKDLKLPIRKLRVDGGAVSNNFLMQYQANVIGCSVERPRITETTALGAAGLAGIAVGVWRHKEHFLRQRKVDRLFKPKLSQSQRDHLYRGWVAAVERSRAWVDSEST